MHDMQMQFTSICKTKYYSHFEAFFFCNSQCLLIEFTKARPKILLYSFQDRISVRKQKRKW